MKIAFVIDTYPTISTFITNQIEGLIKLGHKVYIYPQYKNTIEEGEEEKKFNLTKYVYFPSRYIANRKLKYVTFFRTIFKNLWLTPKQTLYTLNFFIHGKKAIQLTLYYKHLFVLGKKIDIIQAHYGYYGLIALELQKLYNVPLFTMFHGFDIRDGIKKGGNIYHELFNNSNAYVQAISDYNYQHLTNFGAITNRLIKHTVGIDITKFEFKKRNYIKTDKLIILSTGRLVWEKGYEYAINALVELKMANIDFEYKIIGDGYKKNELFELAEKFGLIKHIKFLGLKNNKEIAAELNTPHLFLMPSIAEVLPLALMEALASGVPTIATNVGSINEIVKNNETGILINPGSSIEIVKAIKWMLDNVDKWEYFSQNGRKHIENNFDINKLNKKLAQLYLSKINQ